MIDRETVERIKDASNIVDVVSDFVSLKKSGANYKGLCPFHNERTPSFFVSPSRGICHCFSCGRGGTPVNFIMEHEQMSYVEALKWLAKKYNIEIKERELTSEEQKEQNERESMFIVNEWASNYFEQLLKANDEGISVGLQYFRNRGFRDDIIAKFKLGYDLNNRYSLASTASNLGYKSEFLIKTGLCYQNDRGELIDRYAARVIFPWFSVSGKVVGFGGRLLDSRTKGVAQKYVNSPDSDIFHKNQQLYGIYQAKRTISKEDHVYMVEGYTDVISMHQCGIENVVANSGTALSVHQIRMLRRFTTNITFIYDGDEAGIHAALRGMDIVLAEGMKLKVLLLPDGDDPDSFSRKHNSSEFKDYIEKNASDFIQFKIDLMLKGVTDPVKRSDAINSIITSISVVPDQILRATYIHDCSVRTNILESTIISKMNAMIREGRTSNSVGIEDKYATNEPISKYSINIKEIINSASKIETMIVQMIVKYGNVIVFENIEDEDGNLINLSVSQYINYDLGEDGLSFSIELYNRILREAVEHQDDKDFDAEKYFIHNDDIELSQIANFLVFDKYQYYNVNKEEKQFSSEKDKENSEEKEVENIKNQMLHLLLDFRFEYLERHLKSLLEQIKDKSTTSDKRMALMQEYKEVSNLRNDFARKAGRNIVS